MSHARRITSTLLALAAASTVAAAQGSQPAAATPATAPAIAAPEIGQPAPDFSAPGAGASGQLAQPVTLEAHRGKVVVLAFYPADRSSGCTAELSKFRDEYATLFGNGVVVLPISIDSIGSHASWAKDASFPFTLVSDPDQTIAKQYGSAVPGRKYSSRTVWVIGKDGKILYRDLRFGALNEDAYKTLAAEVAKAKS
jgi:thioredoxin-dependent peroxiredoxin